MGPNDWSRSMVSHTDAEVLSEHVTLEVEYIDRMYLNVYVPKLQFVERYSVRCATGNMVEWMGVCCRGRQGAEYQYPKRHGPLPVPPAGATGFSGAPDADSFLHGTGLFPGQ